jgi:hypothetical protein
LRRLDRTSLVAGLVITLAAAVLLLDRLEVLNLRFDYALPLLIGAVGGILLVAGLEGPRDRQ